MASNLLIKNECRMCNMKFDNRQQLVNHMNKFCVDSEYAQKEKLEKREQQERMLQNPKMFAERNAEEFFRKKKENQMCNIGLMSVLDVKNLLDYKDLQREDNVKIAQKNREEELITKLNGIKDRRSNLWEMQRKGETIMIRLYEFYLKRQKQDLSNHIQMEMILRLKGDLEKYQIMTEYVAQLENLSIQRKKLNQKYKEIYPEINEKHDQIEMDKLKNKNLDELYLTQRNQRVEDLLNRMEYIQREQETISEKYDFIKDKYQQFLEEKQKKDKRYINQQLKQYNCSYSAQPQICNQQTCCQQSCQQQCCQQSCQQQCYQLTCLTCPNQNQCCYPEYYLQQNNCQQYNQFPVNGHCLNQSLQNLNAQDGRYYSNNDEKSRSNLGNVGYYYVQGNQPVYSEIHASHVLTKPKQPDNLKDRVKFDPANDWNTLYKRPKSENYNKQIFYYPK